MKIELPPSAMPTGSAGRRSEGGGAKSAGFPESNFSIRPEVCARYRSPSSTRLVALPRSVVVQKVPKNAAVGAIEGVELRSAYHEAVARRGKVGDAGGRAEARGVDRRAVFATNARDRGRDRGIGRLTVACLRRELARLVQ